MARQADDEPRSSAGANSLRKTFGGRLIGHVAPVLGGKITGGVIVGALIALTGFGPEHWFAVGFEKLRLTQAVAVATKAGVDYRLVLVALGVAIVAFDIWRRERPPHPAVASASNTIAPLVPAALLETNSATPPRLSLVVLPFLNLSAEAGQDYFVDGLTDDITTEMSRLSGAFVIARNTAFTLKGKAVDVKAITREFGVRYALEGTVRKNERSVRLSAKLIDGASGATVWADKFDREVTDLFQLQDAIVNDLAAALNVSLVEAESRRGAHSPHPDATDLIMQAKAQMHLGFDQATLKKAVLFFGEALKRDPYNVEAMAGLAVATGYWGEASRSPNAVRDAERCETIARRGVSLAPNNVRCRAALGLTLRHLGRLEESAREYQEAVRADGNYLPARVGAAVTQIAFGDYDTAEMHLNSATRLSPRDPYMFNFYGSLASIHFARGEYEGALEALRKALDANPGWPPAHGLLIATLGKLDRKQDASRAIAAYNALPAGAKSIADARTSLPLVYGCEPPYAPDLYDGLRRAGFPE